MRAFQLLPLRPLQSGADLPQPAQSSYARLSLHSPAVLAMTDFKVTAPLAVPASTELDEALRLMRDRGERMQFVLAADGDLVGSVTAMDIRGEKPLTFLRSIDCTHRTCAWRDITVGDIMEPVSRWEAVPYDVIIDSTIGDVVATLNRLGRRYLFVIDDASRSTRPTVRGLIADSQLGAHLDIAIDAEHPPRTFFELEQRVTRA